MATARAIQLQSEIEELRRTLDQKEAELAALSQNEVPLLCLIIYNFYNILLQHVIIVSSGPSPSQIQPSTQIHRKR